ncbi:MAG: hypothetical protein WCG06_00565, partial [Candidatus Omnitrophota bacterium]
MKNNLNLEQLSVSSVSLRRFKKITRFVALVTLIAFSAQDLAFGAGGLQAIWREKPFQDNHFLNLPREYAQGRYSKIFDQSQFVINIQDAHESLGAQKSIVKILELLAKDYDLGLVGIEGSSGAVDTALAAAFPVESVRRGVAESLLSQTKISAGEFYRIVSNSKAEIYGVEDRELYARNLEDYKKVIEMRPTAKVQIEKLEKIFQQMEPGVFSDALMRIRKSRRLEQKGEIGIEEFFKNLRDSAAGVGLSCGRYPNLARLVEAMEMEKGIDFTRADAERSDLIRSLAGKLNQKQMQDLVYKSMQTKLGRLSPGRYHGYLAGLIVPAGLEETAYPNLLRYARYCSLYEDADLLTVFGEIAAFEDAIKEQLFRNQAERRLDGFIKYLDLLSKLLDASFSEEEYLRYLALGRDGSVPELKAYLERAGVDPDRVKDVDFDLLSSCTAPALSFYKGARARNRAILDNLVRRMRQKGAPVAALVTGGFHSGGLSELMREDRVSHLVIMPKFDEKEGKRPYVAVITKKGSYLDLETKRQALRETIALTLWTAVDGGMSFPKVKKMYLESFEKSKAVSVCAAPAPIPTLDQTNPSSGREPEGPRQDASRRSFGTSSIFGDNAYSFGQMSQLIAAAQMAGKRIEVGAEVFEGGRRANLATREWECFVTSLGEAGTAPFGFAARPRLPQDVSTVIVSGPADAIGEKKAVRQAARRVVSILSRQSNVMTMTRGRLEIEVG